MVMASEGPSPVLYLDDSLNATLLIMTASFRRRKSLAHWAVVCGDAQGDCSGLLLTRQGTGASARAVEATDLKADASSIARVSRTGWQGQGLESG